MGCWNSSCAISNLPIESGNRVKLLFLRGDELIPEMGENCPIGTCSPDETWAVLPLVISGEYNDYGSIEKVDESVVTAVAINIFKNMSIKGDLKIEACVDDNSAFSNIEGLVDLIERGRVSIKKLGKWSPLGFCMIREDIWDIVCEATPPRRWLKGKKVSLSFQDMLYKFSLLQSMKYAEMSMHADDEFQIFKEIDGKKISVHELSVNRVFEDYSKGLDKKILKPTKAVLEKITREQNEIWIIYTAMHDLRRAFYPPSGTGSQSTNYKLHLALANAVSDICTNKIKRGEDCEW